MRSGFLAATLFCTLLGLQQDSVFLHGPADVSAHGKRHVSAIPVAPFSLHGFEPNRGQMDSAFDFVAQRRGQAIQLRKDGASFIIRGETLNMQLLGVNPHPKVQGAQELPDKRHYFIGSDRTRWATNVTAYSAVEYRDIYGGVDMIYRDSDTLEYDFVVHPGSDPRSIRFRFDGAAGVGRDGELLVRTQHTEIHHHRPIAYQIVDGAKRTVDARFEAFNEDEIGFEVGDYDTSKTLILDPVVVMSGREQR